MLDLMQHHYCNVRAERFHRDLKQKQSVILVREPQQHSVCGFSTQTIVERNHDGRRRLALFSGDTIVDRRWWGDPALGQAWGRFVLQWLDEHPGAECDWFLISQGFRTYRYLSLFFREFYPRYDRPTPPDATARIAAWATQLFAERFDASRGVIRAEADGYSLRDDLAQSGDRAVADPHVAHFLQLNPGHRRGDELCCLAPLSRDNFTRAAWRVIDRPVPVDVG
jgi:hypothetical protein